MVEGGPSHIDTFDPKPLLQKLHLKEFVREGAQKSAMESGKRYYVKSPFQFIKAGKSGADMADNWTHLAGVADELCFYRGCQVDSVNHPTAMYQMNFGNRFGGDPGIGASVTYGLGTVNQDLPGFIVLSEISYPQGGSANWSNGYLPAHYQGTPLRARGSPILDINPPPGVTREQQPQTLDLLGKLNQGHAQQHPWHEELKARMDNYELAFRMQMQVPEVLDLSEEDAKTQEMYGIGKDATDSFGRKCLLARKLVEKGVRGGTAYGRDHNPKAMTMWFAGGGCNAGHTIGSTDDRGMEAVEDVHYVRNVHVTLLRMLGLDDNKLSFYHGGRFKQLSQFGGQVIGKLLS
jgi:hypothetical protein